MLVWNNLRTVQNNNLSFTKIRLVNNIQSSGKIYIEGGYIDTLTHYLYMGEDVYNLNVVNYEGESSKIILVDSSVRAEYEFWSEEQGDIHIVNSSIYECYEKEQVRPTDKSQDWRDTNNIRRIECPVTGNCDTEFRWVESGTICNGVNKHIKLIYQYKYADSSQWVTYTPERYKIGELLEVDSSECGTYEFREEWEEEVCGLELNKLYPYVPFEPYNKYAIKTIHIKPKDGDEWTELVCDTLLDYSLVYVNSFECGWSTVKQETNNIDILCGAEAMEKYPTLTGLTSTSSYNIIETKYYKTLPYPENTDDMLPSEYKYELVQTSYKATINKNNDCGCGYYYIQYDPVEEYICGSEIGMVETTQYQKYIAYKYCDGIKLEATDDYEWRVFDSQSCECGYRIITNEVRYEYDYHCIDGYMHYSKYTDTYSKCVDESIVELIDSVKEDIRCQHSTKTEQTCEWDDETQAYTTRVDRTYRAYLDVLSGDYEYVLCDGNKILESEYTYPKSSSCGYMERWSASGEVCCGYWGYDNAVLTITSVEGDWLRDNNIFTSNTISNGAETRYKINFSVNSDCILRVKYNVSSEANWDKLYIYNVDQVSTSYNYSGQQVGEKTFNIKGGEHYIILKYQKDSSQSSGRDNAIIELEVENVACANYGRYQAEYFQYTIDSGETWVTPEPIKYRYGSLIEANSEECGYVPTLEQWVEICEKDDIDLDNITSDDICIICESYKGAPSMWLAEKKQISNDGGITWEDVYEFGQLVTRTQELLEFKSHTCGYTGETYETREISRVCENAHLYVTTMVYVSYDNGKTWVEVDGSTQIRIEENSSECDEGTE